MFAASAAVLVLFAAFTLPRLRSTPPIDSASGQPPQVESRNEKEEISTSVKDKAAEPQQASQGKAIGAPGNTVKELVQAWNTGDEDRIAALFLPDGVLRMPSGSEIRSRDEIKKTISEHRKGVLRETTLSNSVQQIAKRDDATAVVKGTYRIEGVKIFGFTTSSQGTYEIEQTIRDGRWLIARASVTRE